MSEGTAVAVLEKRGRFVTATPFFSRGRGITIDKPRPGHGKPGDLVLIRLSGPRAGHGKVVRRIGRPDVARDVIEALLYDRGLRRRVDPAVRRAARGAPPHAPHRDTPGPRRPPGPPTVPTGPPAPPPLRRPS